jgi:thioredoxin-like negative regulator of GroEL
MSKPKLHHLLLKAEKARKSQNFEECKRLCEAILRIDKAEMAAVETLALCALETKNFAEAFDAARKLTDAEPSNVNGAMIASVALMNSSQDELAIHILEDQISRTPGVPALFFNLHSAYAALGLNQKALETAMKAIQLVPTNADAYNNLGASLHACARQSDAVIAFQTAVDLNPKHYTARLNLANAISGDDAKIVNEIEYVVREGKKTLSERALVGALHNTAFPYLRLGNLEKGWERLEYGFSPLIDSNRGRRPQRTFVQPRWKGQALNGKTLLVWREQGLGDEIMFASMLDELRNLDGKVILECEPRLVEMFKRSFPTFEVRSEIYRSIFPFDSPNKDFDFQIPIGSLAGIYRNKIEDFQRSKPYWVVDQEKAKEFANRLRSISAGKKLVGLCWRSAVVSPTRSSSYTLLSDWDELLLRQDVCVVNLQYGPCEEELVAAEQRLSIQVLRWQDVNMQKDLDSVAAIIANLDAVCSVGTAVAQISAAVGTRTLLCSSGYGWPSLGTKKYPFQPKVELLGNDDRTGIKSSVDKAIKLI